MSLLAEIYKKVGERRNQNLINEMFNFDVKPFRKKDGTTTNVILVTGDDVDSTKPYKEDMKKFGAKWINGANTWGWYAGTDPNKTQSIINNFVRPAVEFLLSKETNVDEPRDVVKVLDQILALLNTEDTDEEKEAVNNAYMSKSEIQQKIYSFKTKLVNAVSADEFKQMMMPIIKARQAQGYQYSFMNTILIWCQDPKATMVKSRGDWAKMNRTVKEGAPAIGLFIPIGGDRTYKGKDAREKAKTDWMNSHQISSEEDMTPGEKEQLRHYLSTSYGLDIKFKFGMFFYDIRHTVQMEGKEDIVGDPNAKIEWFDDSGNETNAVKEKIECLLEVIKDSGVKVSSVSNLGGALGVSKGGAIDTLTGAKQNSNFLMTICHEFSHELLHQRYLKDQNTEFGQFFVGRPEGRKLVEQQAELSAWIVCQFYGYNMPTGINYAAIWGMDEKNAVRAFDSVAKVADFIINKMNAKIQERRSNNTVQESVSMINEINLTGLDVAKMVGAEKVYQDGMKELQNDNEMSNEEMVESVNNTFNDLFNRMKNL